MANNTLNNVLTIAQDILQLSGLENWQLQPASYNGVAFMMAVNQYVNVDQIPFSGAYSAIQELTGTNTLPFGTSMGTYNVTDSIKRRLVIHDIPGRNGNFFEDQGWSGETFTLKAIFFGIGYQVLYQQALVGMLDDTKVAPSNLHVLVHPVRGVINNCLLTEYSIDNRAGMAQACVLNLTFKADNTPYTETIAISPLTKLYEKIAAIQQLVQDTASAVELTSILFSGSLIGSSGLSGTQRLGTTASANGDMSTLNPLIRAQIDTISDACQRMSNILLYCTKLLYTYMAPPGFRDFYLDPVVIDFSELPELFRFVTIFTDTEIGIIMDYYSNQTAATIALFSVYGLNRILPDKINQLRTSIDQLSQFAELLLLLQDVSTITYKVPYTMSIREVCWLNQIPFLDSDLSPLLLNNRDVIGTTNAIPKGTILKLRQTNG